MEQQVKKTFLPWDIAVLAVIFAAGAACFLPGGGWVDLGFIIILCGVLAAPFCRHGYRLEGRKGLYRLREILLSRENKDEILAYLDGTSDRIDLHPRTQGGALVNVYWRRGESRMLARYFDYADYALGVEYPLREITREQFDALLAAEHKVRT